MSPDRHALGPFARAALAAVSLRHGRLVIDQVVMADLHVRVLTLGTPEKRDAAFELVAAMVRFQRLGGREAKAAVMFCAELVVALLGHARAAAILAPALQPTEVRRLLGGRAPTAAPPPLPSADGPDEGLYALLLGG